MISEFRTHIPLNVRTLRKQEVNSALSADVLTGRQGDICLSIEHQRK